MFSRLFRAIPLKFMLAMIAMTLWIDEEWYPISKFPMYSSHPQKVFFVNITNENDEVIPVLFEFGMRASHLTKVYKTRFAEFYPQGNKPSLSLDSDKSVASKAALALAEYIVDSRQPKLKGPHQYTLLKLWHNSIYRDNTGKIKLNKKLLTEYEVQ